MTGFFDKIEIREDAKRFVKRSVEIGDEILSILRKKGINQKELARLMKKTEPEISKWLSGTHNFTLKTISKIEAILNEDIITIPSNAAKYVFKNETQSKSTLNKSIDANKDCIVRQIDFKASHFKDHNNSNKLENCKKAM